MNKRALITGIGGQDGSLLAELLLDQGYDVSGIVRRSGASYPNLEPLRERIDLVEADLSDQLALVRALRATRPHEVYNLASVSFVPASWEHPVLTAELAAVGVTALLEAIREVDATIRFYQASSSEIFGEPRESPQTEETPLSPLTPYGVAKAYAHFIVRSYRIRYGLHASAGILYNHESPRRPLEFVPRKVAHAAAAISLGLEGELWLGDLDSRRDWGYAGDYVRAMWLMVQQDEGDDYVVATGVTRSVRDLVETAFEHVGLDSREYVHIDESLQRGTAELHNLVGDPAKAKRELGWEPTVVVRGARPADGRRRARAAPRRSRTGHLVTGPSERLGRRGDQCGVALSEPKRERALQLLDALRRPAGVDEALAEVLEREVLELGRFDASERGGLAQHRDACVVLVPAAMRLADPDHRLDPCGLVGSCGQAPSQVVERLVGPAEDARRVAQIAQQPRLGARVALRQLRLGSDDRGFDRLGVCRDLAQPFVPLGER